MDELWTAQQVGAYLQVSARQVAERYAFTPGFPKAVRLPSLTGARAIKRWPRSEILKWVERLR